MPRCEQAHMAVFEDRNQNHAGDEATDVRVSGGTTLDVASGVSPDVP